MKKTESLSPPAVGGASALVVFAVLCLTVFSLLCLSTVLAEKRIADASLESVTAYYEADLQAQRIFARLRGGETVPGVESAGDTYAFTCPISENQWLEVRLEKTEDGWIVLRWQAIAGTEETAQTLPVWQDTP